MSRYPQTMLATCCVPWHEDSRVDEEIFRASIRTLIEQGLEDLYVFGTAGEGYAVNERQFDDVVRIFVDELRGDGLPPMVGVISLSLSTVIERIERSAELGVELFQISLPSWGELGDRELATFFAETCGRFPGLRFLHYNLPRARRVVTPGEYAELAARHANLIGTKNAGATPAILAELLAQAGELRHFVTEPGYAHGSLVGPCGFLLSYSSLNPELAREYFQAGVRKDAGTLTALGLELAGILSALAGAFGGPRIDGAYDKIFNRAHDARFPLRLLPPYEGASEAEYERFVAAVRELYPRWLPVSA
ncbi:MAG: dihydrodipicolinate synthase family protein [Actinobacteria bacterium]|nr:dihydrodipicolinate synthase family protein [Actinomycetota bacterium]